MKRIHCKRTRNRRIPPVAVPLCMAWLIGCASLLAAESFENQRKSVAAAVESQTESVVLSMLEAGIAENMPAPALALANEWLRRNVPKDAKTLMAAGRAAELSGDWRNAAALYQQSTKLGDPKSEETGEAIAAAHALWIDMLQEQEAAYTFGLAEASRLAVNPRFRQWDRWFLELAKSKQDRSAVARRLLATATSGVSQDDLDVFYADDIRWLLESIRGARYDEKADRFPDAFTAAVKGLAKAISFDRELSLLLDWAVSVKAYHMAVLDDQKADPPMESAKILLDAYPGYAERVQTDWAGGHNGRHYRGDVKKYWSDQTEAKMSQIMATLPKLTPLKQADLLKTWSGNFYDSGPILFSPEQVREMVLTKPELFNQRTSPRFSFAWEKLKPEEMTALAAKLDRNPSPEAALIRAIVAAGPDKNADRILDILLTDEAWRLGTVELEGAYADRIWHYAGRPEGAGKRDQMIAKSKQLLASLPKLESDPQAPADQRLAHFRKLWDDYLSPQPRMPAVRQRLGTMLRVTPEAVPMLLAHDSVEAKILLREALASDFLGPKGPLSGESNVVGLSPHGYDPLILRKAARHGGLDRMRQQKPELFVAHPLEPELRKAVEEGLKGNRLESWLVNSWINAQLPGGSPESAKVMETLHASPAFAQLPESARYAARAMFGEKAMLPAHFQRLQSADAATVCKPLLDLSKEANPGQAADALTAVIDGMRRSPVRIAPLGLDQLVNVDSAVFSDDRVHALCVEWVDQARFYQPSQRFGELLFTELRRRGNPSDLLRSSAFLWNHIAAYHRNYPAMLEWIGSLVEAQPSCASTFAIGGLSAIERHRTGHTWFKRETDIPFLKSVRGKAAIRLGLVVIPVAQDHPAYPIYQAQADWMMGNEEAAWKGIEANWEAFQSMQKELTFPFLMWVLDRTGYARNDVAQEFVIKSLLSWANEKDSSLTVQEKARIDIAYGDIALQRGQMRQAHEIFSRVRKNEANAELPERHVAALRQVRAERMAKNYDAALQTLAELEMEKVADIWTDVRFGRAEVHFDMEEYEDAKEDIDSILARDPDHADSRILLGKVQLRRKKLMEATEVEIGSTTGQESLVPGESLKVTLSDPTLEVSGAGMETEVVVWAGSGDKETFFLRQFGDQKTKFRGEIPTALGAPNPGDGILQVIGSDEVFYSYSERFLQKMNLTDPKRGGPITIASDAVLMASARKLLTEAEQRTADMQEMMQNIRTKSDVPSAVAKAMWADSMLNRDDDDGGEKSLLKRIDHIAKPGNPVYVRVVDPDRSRTAEIDSLTVSVGTSSGDSISSVTLKETETHSGIFEGSIPTTGAQAQAMAEHSEAGRSPNMVISPRDDYPAWKPVDMKGQLHSFVVDLNDHIELGTLNIIAREPGAALRKFQVQTAMNASEWTTVATWPKTNVALEQPWKPSVMVANEDGRNHHYGARSVYEIHDLRKHMESGWLAHQPDMAVAKTVSGPSAALPSSIPTDIPWRRSGRFENPAVVVRFQAWFHESDSVTRRFALQLGQAPKSTVMADPKQQKEPAQFLIAVDGRVITDQEKKELAGEINLKPGMHKLEIWATGWLGNIGFGREVKLLANLQDAEMLVDCPDSFFDPSTFPSSLLDHRNGPADITEVDGGNEFKVAFAKGSSARKIRIQFLDQEGPVPVLNRLALTKPDGSRVLPVDADFAELNRNDILEMLTGDQLSVRYVDDRFVTKSKQRHERFLSVAFTDAKVEFADMNPRVNPRNQEEEPYYETLLRFAHDQPLSLAIHDIDMDSTVNPDKVPVKLETDAGIREFVAVETGDSTGIFKLVITPVQGEPQGENQIRVAEGGGITASYLDQENNRPGVPQVRSATIRHAAFTQPSFFLAHSTVEPLQGTPSAATTLHHGFEKLGPEIEGKSRMASELVSPAWVHRQKMMPYDQAPEGGFQAVLGQEFHIEVLVPQLALGERSTIKVYAQTDAGRAAGGESGGGFNIQTPGSILLEGSIYKPNLINRQWHGVPMLPTYANEPLEIIDSNPAMERFRCSVPLISGMLPSHGALTFEELYQLRKEAMAELGGGPIPDYPNGLVVRPGENIHLGFSYQDREGKTQWITASARVISHPVFDIMDEEFRSSVASAYVGEELHLRVIDLGADTSDAHDKVQVALQAKSGAKQMVELHESGPHTGIFRAAQVLSYIVEGGQDTNQPQPGDEPAEEEPAEERVAGLPVIYGDSVAARYTDAHGLKTDTRFVTVSKGADGTIEPFSKQYDDPEIAMRTQFSLAEAYLEVARRHRKLDEKEAADLGFEAARQLLAKAMDQFTDPDTRAHAEYLLGTLTMEDAEITEDTELRETRYRAALSRFLNITGSYGQTLHASKAQYQIATIYERLQEPEIAAQEYVKLAYKYPDSEFLAVSMARLGTHFLKKASTYEEQAKPLLAKAAEEENKDAGFEGEALMKMAVAEYLKTAQIFGRLQQRFPGDPLAGQAGLRAGQAYMRAGKNQEAVDVFQRIAKDEGYDGVTIRAQAMYWAGMCYQSLRQPLAAYSVFKRLTYDFPESEWAAYARGQLSQDGMLNLETQLELERLEGEQ